MPRQRHGKSQNLDDAKNHLAFQHPPFLDFLFSQQTTKVTRIRLTPNYTIGKNRNGRAPFASTRPRNMTNYFYTRRNIFLAPSWSRPCILREWEKNVLENTTMRHRGVSKNIRTFLTFIGAIQKIQIQFTDLIPRQTCIVRSIKFLQLQPYISRFGDRFFPWPDSADVSNFKGIR